MLGGFRRAKPGFRLVVPLMGLLAVWLRFSQGRFLVGSFKRGRSLP